MTPNIADIDWNRWWRQKRNQTYIHIYSYFYVYLNVYKYEFCLILYKNNINIIIQYPLVVLILCQRHFQFDPFIKQFRCCSQKSSHILTSSLVCFFVSGDVYHFRCCLEDLQLLICLHVLCCLWFLANEK